MPQPPPLCNATVDIFAAQHIFSHAAAFIRLYVNSLIFSAIIFTAYKFNALLAGVAPFDIYDSNECAKASHPVHAVIFSGIKRTSNGFCTKYSRFGSAPVFTVYRLSTGRYEVRLSRDSLNIMPIVVGWGHTNIKGSIYSVSRKTTILGAFEHIAIDIGISDDSSLNDASFRVVIFEY